MNNNLDKLAEKLAKDIEKDIFKSLSDTRFDKINAMTTTNKQQPFDFDDIEKLITTANKIKQEASDKLYNNLKDKTFIVPSESSKWMLYEALEQEIGNRAYELDVRVSNEVDDIMVVDSKYFDK